MFLTTAITVFPDDDMSLREIARELYRLQKEVEKLERELDAAGPDAEAVLRQKLRRASAEKRRMRRILDGRIDRSGP